MDFQSLKNILKLLSAIGIGVGLFFTIPVGVGFIYKENVGYFFVFWLLFLLVNFLMQLLLYKHKLKMSVKDAILAVNVVWILLGIAGGAGLYLTSNISMVDAFFEAISGFTTTGATIYDDIASLPHTTLMLRSLMHWLGGMGVIVLGVGLLTLLNPSGSLTLFKSESTGISVEKLTPKIKDTAKWLWGIYLILTFMDALLLYMGGMDSFDAINHAFSTISTGGFSTKNESLAYWDHNYFILWVTTIFMFLSGVNFLVYLRALHKDFGGFFSEEVRWYAIIFFVLALALTFVHFLLGHDTFMHAATHAFFTIASILTTTGFASINYASWSSEATALIFIAMYIGANAGSTAGGVKVIRYVVLFKNLFAQMKQNLHPSAIIGVYIDGKRVSGKILSSVSGFFFIYVISNLLLSLFLYAKGYDFLTAVSAAIACIGNIGPGFGQVGPVDNFAFFSDFEKIILALFMIIGRLEFYTFIVLFSREFWRRF